MIQVTLYSRKDCHLCEQALADLESLRAQIPHQVDIIDVDTDARLKKEYGLEIPVVEVGPYKLKAPFSKGALEMTLSAARDRVQHIDRILESSTSEEVAGSTTWRGSDQFTYWISRHYMFLFNLFVSFYLGLALLAPVLMRVGLPAPAAVIYRVYSNMCHQLAYRSVFIFGEQAFYPRAAAGVSGLLTYEQATGNGEGSTYDEILTARNYRGDERVGYKIALCQRDLAIYGGILLFGLLFSLSRNRLPPIPWYVWILLGIVPIGLDGLSQLISQPPLSFIPFRESTPFLRLLTGGLFGFFTAWFGYPMVEQTMSETRQIMHAKWLRVQRSA